MTNHFKNMLYLFAANAVGTNPQIEGEIDVEEIRRLSVEQGIWSMVYPELAKVADASKYQMSFFKTVSQGIVRKEFNLNIIKKLEDAGIKCCILKGAAISCLYKDPECRISGDTDILIDTDDEKRALRVLEENGYRVEDRDTYDHDTKAIHPVGGLLEVHISMCNDITKRVIFGGLEMYQEPWSQIEIDGKTYNTLGINDGMVYLTAHFIKHLINDGGGVRQMMDLLLYMKTNEDKIDFAKSNKIMRELKYDKVVEAIKTIGGKYFGLDFEVTEEALADRLLDDTEEGGIFGFEADDRGQFYKIYCDKRATAGDKYKSLISLKSDRNIVAKLFPSSKRLVEYLGYGYAKNKLLVPVAWIHRYFDILTGRRKKFNNDSQTEGFKNRMQMMKDLGMID